jgi:hypothetical protein
MRQPIGVVASVLLARISSARYPHRTRRMLAGGRLEFVGIARTLTASDAATSFVKRAPARRRALKRARITFKGRRATIDNIPASEETTNTQRFEADSLAGGPGFEP